MPIINRLFMSCISDVGQLLPRLFSVEIEYHIQYPFPAVSVGIEVGMTRRVKNVDKTISFYRA